MKNLKSGATKEDRVKFWEERQKMHETIPLPNMRRADDEGSKRDEDDEKPVIELSDDMIEYRKQNASLLKLIGNRPPKVIPEGTPKFENPFDPMDEKIVQFHRVFKKMKNEELPKVITAKGEVKNAPAKPYRDHVVTSFSRGLLPNSHESVLR